LVVSDCGNLYALANGMSPLLLAPGVDNGLVPYERSAIEGDARGLSPFPPCQDIDCIIWSDNVR
jgi:hypothetical protein